MKLATNNWKINKKYDKQKVYDTAIKVPVEIKDNQAALMLTSEMDLNLLFNPSEIYTYKFIENGSPLTLYTKIKLIKSQAQNDLRTIYVFNMISVGSQDPLQVEVGYIWDTNIQKYKLFVSSSFGSNPYQNIIISLFRNPISDNAQMGEGVEFDGYRFVLPDGILEEDNLGNSLKDGAWADIVFTTDLKNGHYSLWVNGRKIFYYKAETDTRTYTAYIGNNTLSIATNRNLPARALSVTYLRFFGIYKKYFNTKTIKLLERTKYPLSLGPTLLAYDFNETAEPYGANHKFKTKGLLDDTLDLLVENYNKYAGKVSSTSLSPVINEPISYSYYYSNNMFGIQNLDISDDNSDSNYYYTNDSIDGIGVQNLNND